MGYSADRNGGTQAHNENNANGGNGETFENMRDDPHGFVYRARSRAKRRQVCGHSVFVSRFTPSHKAIYGKQSLNYGANMARHGFS